MRRLIWSPSSLGDLRAIDAYLSDRNDRAAAKMLRLIKAAALRLLDHPRIGRALSAPFRVIGVRQTPYLIVYRLMSDDVEIVRIRHGREDWLGPIEGEL